VQNTIHVDKKLQYKIFIFYFLKNQKQMTTATAPTPTSTVQNDTSSAIQSLQLTRTRCEVWTRVMGYHRPVNHFNNGKKSEHFSRNHFQETITANSGFCSAF
jgi:anaerobic ribonucleoside-triphosphate reductase